ncbi:MAG: hypothetical protein WBA97_08325, partial [Actinophytocola sp.]|uniref:hypothetical protein n=1 Tax=Actinophytocola sp. TaxID=1872138 RepID=UPI003C7911BB
SLRVATRNVSLGVFGVSARSQRPDLPRRHQTCHQIPIICGTQVLRFLDADAGRDEPTTVADELALADALTTSADAVRSRAEWRIRQGDADAPAATWTSDIQSGDATTGTEGV